MEAAHLQGGIHRDLKPENILWDKKIARLAIADFGIARFNEEIVATFVETAPSQRLANFQYAAPEQRRPGQTVGQTADIYSLGMILNEMFTGDIPLGTHYRLIESVDRQFGFLDNLVAKMLAQSAADRPQSITDAKVFIQRYQAEAVSLQRISQIDGTVIRLGEIDDPLAREPPRLIGADWERGRLTLTLDRPVSQQWIEALQNVSGLTAVLGKGPGSFSFTGNKASVNAMEHEVQSVIDFFKDWLPKASLSLKTRLEVAAQQQENQRREQLRRDREEEEKRLRVLKSLRI